MSDQRDDANGENEAGESFPPLPIDPELAHPWRSLRWAVAGLILVLSRCGMSALGADRADARGDDSVWGVGAGAEVSDEDRAAVERAIRAGAPLELDSSGRLRPAGGAQESDEAR